MTAGTIGQLHVYLALEKGDTTKCYTRKTDSVWAFVKEDRPSHPQTADLTKLIHAVVTGAFQIQEMYRDASGFGSLAPTNEESINWLESAAATAFHRSNIVSYNPDRPIIFHPPTGTLMESWAAQTNRGPTNTFRLPRHKVSPKEESRMMDLFGLERTIDGRSTFKVGTLKPNRDGRICKESRTDKTAHGISGAMRRLLAEINVNSDPGYESEVES